MDRPANQPLERTGQTARPRTQRLGVPLGGIGWHDEPHRVSRLSSGPLQYQVEEARELLERVGVKP